MLEEGLGEEQENFKVIYTYEVKSKVENKAAQVEVKDETFTVYISGIDVYGAIETNSRSDVNILAVVNPNTHQVLLEMCIRDRYKIQEKEGIDMENQYNYYHSEEPQNDSSYSSQPNPEHHEKPKKKMPKAVVVTGCALLFGVVSSATFLTTNVVGNKVLGLDQKAAKEVSNTTQNKATLTKTSSVVTSDVSSVVESVMPSIVSITNMSVQQVQSFFGGDVYKRQERDV